ncbi:MAG: hypothetical protein Q4G28_05270 [Neisseria sp.]|nr:hypothetical protein [Neisseria sp.]
MYSALLRALQRYLFALVGLIALMFAGGCNTPETTPADYFLHGTDWQQGGYALVMVDSEGKASLVADPEILRAHEGVLLAKEDAWRSLLPIGSRDLRALYLFQNRRLVKSVWHRVYQQFETGSLAEHTRPLTSRYTDSEPKAAYLARLARLQSQENVWIYQQSEVRPFQYWFTVKLPTVAVFHGQNAPPTEDEFYQSVLGKQLYAQIEADLKQDFDTAEFDMSNVNRNIWASSLIAPYLYRSDHQTNGLLQDAAHTPLTAEGWTFYQYDLTVFGTPELYEKMQQHDFARYLDDYRGNLAEWQAFLAQQADKAQPAITPGQIRAEGYRDSVHIGSLYELEYSLSYFELPPHTD